MESSYCAADELFFLLLPRSMVLSSGMGGKSEDGENWMADRIRKRRGVLDGDGAGNNFDEAQTVEDLMASETDFDDPVSGPHFPNYRLSKRTISGASYRTDEDTDYSEYEALIKSKVSNFKHNKL